MPSGQENLKNLVRQGSLKVEQPDQVEFAGRGEEEGFHKGEKW